MPCGSGYPAVLGMIILTPHQSLHVLVALSSFDASDCRYSLTDHPCSHDYTMICVPRTLPTNRIAYMYLVDCGVQPSTVLRPTADSDALLASPLPRTRRSIRHGHLRPAHLRRSSPTSDRTQHHDEEFLARLPYRRPPPSTGRPHAMYMYHRTHPSSHHPSINHHHHQSIKSPFPSCTPQARSHAKPAPG